MASSIGVSWTETERLFDVIPVEKAILLEAIHGVGKSEFIQNWGKRNGYRVVQIFLSTYESGDILGLPDKKTVLVMIDGQEKTRKITEFCSPEWWPQDSEEKVLIFFDELNRAKDECLQMIQNIVLNREFNGMKLHKTKIVAAINPSDSDIGYQVSILDAALFSRFAVIRFRPTHSELINHAIDSKWNKHTIGFLSKTGITYLDPPTENYKSDEVYPTRRSWKHLSDVLKENEWILNDNTLLENLCMSYIGTDATSAFRTYIREMHRGLDAGIVVTGWNNSLVDIIQSMHKQNIIAFNSQLALYLNENEEDLFSENVTGSKQRNEYCYNVYQYLKAASESSTKEVIHHFVDYMSKAKSDGKIWPSHLTDFEPIANYISDVFTFRNTGVDKEE